MNDGKRFLPKEFEPGFHDVLLGRGKRCYQHFGTKNFLSVVASTLGKYSSATSKAEKSRIIVSVVSKIQKRNPYGGFIKKDSETGRWYQVGEFVARERTSQAFRDALHDSYKSSNSSRKKRRKNKLANTASFNQSVQPKFSCDQQFDVVSESTSSTTAKESQLSSIYSHLLDQRCNVEAFDNILDEICPPGDTSLDLDLHDFEIENSNDISIINIDLERQR